MMKRNQGFTLTELICTMVVALPIIFMMGTFLVTKIEWYTVENKRIMLQKEESTLNFNLEELFREVNLMKEDQGTWYMERGQDVFWLEYNSPVLSIRTKRGKEIELSSNLTSFEIKEQEGYPYATWRIKGTMETTSGKTQLLIPIDRLLTSRNMRK